MSLPRAKHILSEGEGIRVEYKEARNQLPKNLFESVCAMVNRDGGDIILGANDDGQPQFIEGPVFKMVIPLAEEVSGGVIEGEAEGVNYTIRDTVNDTVRDTVRDTVKERMARMIIHLYQHPGLKSKELAKVLDVSEVSVRRDIQKIKRLVEFKGAPKTEGYALSQELHDKLYDKKRRK